MDAHRCSLSWSFHRAGPFVLSSRAAHPWSALVDATDTLWCR